VPCNDENINGDDCLFDSLLFSGVIDVDGAKNVRAKILLLWSFVVLLPVWRHILPMRREVEVVIEETISKLLNILVIDLVTAALVSEVIIM